MSINVSTRNGGPAHGPPFQWLAGLSAIGSDFVRQSISGEAFRPRNMVRTAVRCVAASAQAMADSGGRPEWREVQNKLRAWELFRYANPVATELGPFEAVWTTEGIGYSCVRGLRAVVQQSPGNARVPLHSGFGLALSEKALGQAESSGDLRPALRNFQYECDAQAAPGCGEILFEALGLTAITLYPHLVSGIDRELSGAGDALGALFWHGVGRGLYFTPLSFIPVAAMRNRAIEFARNASLSEVGRRNAMAGIAWAITLVNVCDPEVMGSWLGECGVAPGEMEAFENGVTSALIVWESAAPDGGHMDLLAGSDVSLLRSGAGRARKLVNEDRTGDLAAKVFRVREDVPG